MRGAPQVGILGNHMENQVPDLLRNPLSAGVLPHPGDHPPVQPKAVSVPADHGLWGDKDERLLPAGPEPASGNPEKFVQHVELGPGLPAFQHRELLPKSQVLEEQSLPGTEGENEGFKPQPEKRNMEE